MKEQQKVRPLIGKWAGIKCEIDLIFDNGQATIINADYPGEFDIVKITDLVEVE